MKLHVVHLIEEKHYEKRIGMCGKPWVAPPPQNNVHLILCEACRTYAYPKGKRWWRRNA